MSDPKEPCGWKPAGLLLLSALAFGACGSEEAELPAQPALVDWSGMDGRALPLDQPIRLEFDRPLAAPVRTGAIELFDAEGQRVGGLSLDANGRFLSLSPRIPLRPDLSDGSLRPDTEYQLQLHGAPRLDALHTVDGGVLVGDRGIRFHTLPVSDPEALIGIGGILDPLRIQGMAPGATWQVEAGSRGGLLRMSAGVDPRSLGPARLLGSDGAEVGHCPLILRENLSSGALLEVDFEGWTGWGVLELPALEGLGGSPLAEAQRSLRVHCTP